MRHPSKKHDQTSGRIFELFTNRCRSSCFPAALLPTASPFRNSGHLPGIAIFVGQSHASASAVSNPTEAESRTADLQRRNQTSGMLKVRSAIAGLIASAGGIVMLAPVAMAQQTNPSPAPPIAVPQPAAQEGAASALSEDIIVTATKRPEDVQTVPLAVTGFGSAQLEALNFRNLGSLGFSVPNVQLNDNGAQPGYQNFSIRGLGINSSIPSIDPTVGVFVDGVYQGINAGVLTDNFDLEAIEVLRGPQGVLFGRNVTGGAIVIRTKKPTNTLTMNARVAVETGTKTIADASVSGPIISDILTAKLAAYYSYDDGYFTNSFNGRASGKSRQSILRPMLRFTPSSNLEMLLRYEHGEASGDGSVAQNRALFSKKSKKSNNNEQGFFDNDWDGVTFETNLGTGFGDGSITNIFGYRRFKSVGLSDIDATQFTSFHLDTYTDQDQYSNELRYAGTFGRVEVTTGLYYFTQNLTYLERRTLANGTVIRVGGGSGRFQTAGAFAVADWHFTNTLTLNAGARYTYEKKRASIGTVRAGGGDYLARNIVADFNDAQSWKDVSPKVGLQWQPTLATQAYGYYAKGFRSGGYNFRNTLVGAAPGPFDSEDQNSYEIGIKQKLFGNRARINLAAFTNKIAGIQREIQTPIANVGVAQVIRNVGDVRVRGFEGEAQISLTKRFLLSGLFGYTQSKYLSLDFDLTGDGIIDARDFALKLPRQAPWTYGATAVYDLPLGAGLVSTRATYNHRDANFHTDNNLGIIDKTNTVDLNITYTPNGSNWSLSVYGTNLTNQTIISSNAPLTDIPSFGGDGPTGPRPVPDYAPLAKGRVIGGEFRFHY